LDAAAVPRDRLAGKEFLYERNGIPQLVAQWRPIRPERCVDGAAVILTRIIVGLDSGTNITSSHDKIVLGFREGGCVG
jgi:hypothetical protein